MIRLLIVSTIVTLGLGASLFSRFAGLQLYLWFAFFRPQEWVWIDITDLRLSLVIAIALVVPSFFTATLPDFKHPLSRAMWVILLAAFAAEFATPSPRTEWNWLQLVAQSTIINLLLVTIVNTPERLKWAAAVVVGSVGFHVAKQGLASILSPGVRLTEGVGGSFGDNNSYAVVCVMVALLLLAGARLPWARRVQLGCTTAGVLSMLTVVATFSRGGFLALLTALFVYTLLRGLRSKWIIAGAAAVIMVVSFVPMPSGYVDRMKTIETYGEDASAENRLHFWRVALDMAADQPLGVGVQNFNSVYDQYDYLDGAYGRSRSVHNSHLQILTEAGFLGFAAWVFLLWFAVVVAFRVRRRAKQVDLPNAALYAALADGMIAAMAGFVVGATFTAIAWSDFLGAIIGIIAALDLVSSREATSTVTATVPVKVKESAHDKAVALVGAFRPARGLHSRHP
jgi:probable O-glycosylation ligase (exosortase A-associated)